MTRKKYKKKKLGTKKGILSMLLVAGMLCTSGCGQVIELTDEENHLIAEYAAELLLKYDRGYKQKYEPDLIETTTEAELTEATTEATTEAETETETTETVAETTQTTEAAVAESEPLKEAVEATLDSDFDIGTFVGESDVSIRYTEYVMLESYPSYDQDGVYIEVEAPEGYKLLVLKFNIENKTDLDKELNLYSKDVRYDIIVDNTRKTRQMFTILIDDLYTYDTVIPAQAQEEAVLLYTVSDSVADTLSDLKLQVTYDDAIAVLRLTQ